MAENQRTHRTMDSRRKERKRLLDRDAQRAARARTKAQIAQLEAAVSSLTEELEKERSRHQINPNVQPQKGQAVGNSNEAQEPLSSMPWNFDVESAAHQLELATWEMVPTSATHQLGAEVVPYHIPKPVPNRSNGSPIETIHLNPSEARRSESVPHTTLDFAQALSCSPDDNFLEILDKTIAFVELIGRHHDFADYTTDQDIVIRAVFYGWKAVEHRYPNLDIGWRFLKALDEVMWFPAGPVERIVQLTMSRCVLVRRTFLKDIHRHMVPAFMLPTRTQRNCPDRPIANYIAWPDGRDVLAKNRDLHNSLAYAQQFATNFYFRWPYETRDVYLRDRDNDKYALSERFLAAFNDLRSFQRPMQEPVATLVDSPETAVNGNTSTKAVEVSRLLDNTHDNTDLPWLNDLWTMPQHIDSAITIPPELIFS